MRGKAGAAQRSLSPSRITPACAGKSTQYFPACSCIWDHPRVCGEKDRVVIMVLATMGSPPRVRGKASPGCRTATSSRITPAYAGKRIKLRKRHSICGDHPRMCGEKALGNSIALPQCGSPPRVQGKVHVGDLVVFQQGITPAYAGKRCRSPAFRSMPWDHPRVCGEKCLLYRRPPTASGSPPRVRGKVPSSI